MKSTTALFYLPSHDQLLLNETAYEQIRSHIDFAIVLKYQDVYTLHLTCPHVLQHRGILIQNGKETTAQNACTFCTQRLKWVTGIGCTGFRPIKKGAVTGFSPLAEFLKKQHAKSDAELLFYADWQETLQSDGENETGDFSYKEYTALLSFFTKLNTGIEQLHRCLRLFPKVFR